MMCKAITTTHGPIPLPAFFPDATRAGVRAVDAQDLKACGVAGVVVSQFHLRNSPGVEVIRSLEGVHKYMGWNGPVLSDSGGFQLFSLLRESPDLGSISKKGFLYRTDRGGARKRLTPEKAIRGQFALGSDIVVCLDHCTHPDDDDDRQRASVEHTLDWAAVGKRTFDELVDSHQRRPLLFAVVQGGRNKSLRRECAERLLEIGFDGYGYGGWPIDQDGRLVDAVAFVAELIPSKFPLWGLGIGKPEHVVDACRMGYRLFDCVLPSRDGRHGRLYVSTGETGAYRHVYIMDHKHVRTAEPIDPQCSCLACRHYSLGYLHHLFRIRDPAALRLATLHNLTFYVELMKSLSEKGDWLRAESE